MREKGSGGHDRLLVGTEGQRLALQANLLALAKQAGGTVFTFFTTACFSDAAGEEGDEIRTRRAAEEVGARYLPAYWGQVGAYTDRVRPDAMTTLVLSVSMSISVKTNRCNQG